MRLKEAKAASDKIRTENVIMCRPHEIRALGLIKYKFEVSEPAEVGGLPYEAYSLVFFRVGSDLSSHAKPQSVFAFFLTVDCQVGELRSPLTIYEGKDSLSLFIYSSVPYGYPTLSLEHGQTCHTPGQYLKAWLHFLQGSSPLPLY